MRLSMRLAAKRFPFEFRTISTKSRVSFVAGKKAPSGGAARTKEAFARRAAPNRWRWKGVMSVIDRIRRLGSIGRCLALCSARKHSRRDLIWRSLDRDQLVQDVGIAMSDMAALTRSEAPPAVLLSQRLELIGLDPRYLEVADYATWEDLRQTCARCVSWRQCARDLAQAQAQAGLADYCPNGPLIDRLLVERWQPRSSTID